MKTHIYISTTLLQLLDLYELQRWTQEANLILLNLGYTTENKDVQIRLRANCPDIATKSPSQIMSVQPNSVLVVSDCDQLPYLSWQFNTTYLVGDKAGQMTDNSAIHVSTIHEVRKISAMDSEGRQMYLQFNRTVDAKIQEFKNRDAADFIRKMAEHIGNTLTHLRSQALLKSLRQLERLTVLIQDRKRKAKSLALNGWRIVVLEKQIEAKHVKLVEATIEQDRKIKLLRKAFDGLKILYVKY